MLRLRTKFILLALASLLLAGQWGSFAKQVHAASPADFKAGNIISDLVFTDSNAMNAAQIQSFLEAKSSVCLTSFKTLSLHDANNDGYGDEPYGRGQGDKVLASKLIWQAAQIYDINPKVILVTLQKEQGLITRDDCPAWRYRTALGYGCPDSAPCDDSAYGFTRQVDYGVWHFRGFFYDSLAYVPYTPGDHHIAYNPDSSCGSSVVNIKNRATAALYSYTPYQPNQAALNAGYGIGNSCSSYGNRNFWRYFTDWFGSTQGTPFFKLKNGTAIYMLGADNSYYYVPSNSVLRAYGYWQTVHAVKIVGDSYTENMSFAGRLTLAAQYEDDAIYFVSAGQRYHVPNTATLSAYGFSSENVSKLVSGAKYYLQEAQTATTVLSPTNKDRIYVVEAGKRHHIVDGVAYSTKGNPAYNTIRLTNISQFFVDRIPEGAPVFSEGTPVMNTTTNTFGFYENDALRTAASVQIGRDWGLPYVYRASSTLLSSLSAGQPIGRFVASPDGKKFILDNGKKVLVDTDAIAELGLNPTTFDTMSKTSLANIPAVNFYGLVRPVGNPAVYEVREGALLHIYSAEDFQHKGHEWPHVLPMSQGFISTLENNQIQAFADSRLMQLQGEPEIYVINQNSTTKHHIPSLALFHNYGWEASDVVQVNASTVNHYPEALPLTRLAKDEDSQLWLVDSTTRWQVPEELQGANAYNFDTTNIVTLSGRNLSRLPAAQLTSLVRDETNGRVYKISNGQKRWYINASAFVVNGGDWSKVRDLSPSFINSIPNGQDIK